MDMKKIAKIMLKPLLIVIAAIGAVFSVYIFNLDMKLLAYVIEPFLQKIYDKKERKQYV